MANWVPSNWILCPLKLTDAVGELRDGRPLTIPAAGHVDRLDGASAQALELRRQAALLLQVGPILVSLLHLGNVGLQKYVGSLYTTSFLQP